ncbi:DUF559 domain-containing protein [Corynebacterium meitnerae]|uniref:DUF559 domain-containing protein n=1 Tax=Corynebacterium meitnerae TaxID=2913498 RepID=UPI0022BA4385|nr:DUF559 domain-containing protein [Corynebacterium meitnerae]
MDRGIGLVEGLVDKRRSDEHMVAVSALRAISAEVHRGLTSYEKRWLRAAAVAHSHPKAVLTGRAAARLTNMWVVATSEETVELMLPSGGVPQRSRWAEGVSYHRGTLAPHEIGYIEAYGGFAVTTPIRTAVDIAIRHGFAEGLVAFDWLLASRTTTRDELEATVDAMRGKKGVAVVRKALAHAVANSQSPYESYARALLICAGLAPSTQAPIGPYLVDLLIGRVVIEVDGEVKYDDATYRPLAETLRREREREVQIQNSGYVVRRVKPADLLRDPDGFVAGVMAALRANGSV